MVFFTLAVESPASVSGDYEAVPAAFGKEHTEGVLRMNMVDCGDGSNKMTRREIYRKCALCRRGKKTDMELIMAQQTNYARCVLLINDSRDKPTPIELPIGQTRDPVLHYK